MNRRFLALLALLVPWPAAAHNPEISTYLLVRDGSAWRLNVSLSTAGLDRALTARLGRDARTLSLDEYGTEVERAVREGVQLRLNDSPVTLGAATRQLGSHESELAFAVDGAPERIASVDGTVVRALAEVRNQH